MYNITSGYCKITSNVKACVASITGIQHQHYGENHRISILRQRSGTAAGANVLRLGTKQLFKQLLNALAKMDGKLQEQFLYEESHHQREEKRPGISLGCLEESKKMELRIYYSTLWSMETVWRQWRI
ncbi:hypothetical protein CEXT_54771 [Caerostris extrusa]|uniref:Uncharacterized protein n=1 Tax=Caerostris extrusa TaxID=172846 RepID=A0AAV4MPP8_CAEEX|nr:hypothetical protein CEXT_54771 [Caerostris extrusa]